MITLENIRIARKRIASHIKLTPLMESKSLNELSGARLFFKAEHLQLAGAFKIRGAVNAILQLPFDSVVSGVATHSSGNHGAALARAAQISNVRASVVMPVNATASKRQAVIHYGGKVIDCAPGLAAREETLRNHVAETGDIVIPPYDDERIICGQGTVALELAEQLPDLDAVVVPVGGGGLLGGISLTLKQMGMSTRIYGAEPESADDASRSFVSGVRVSSHEPNTICDGLQTVLGELNFAIIRKYTDDILLVSENEIVEAMKLIWTRMKQVIEPSSAVTLAAVLKYPSLFAGKSVALVLTGGNVDLNKLPFN